MCRLVAHLGAPTFLSEHVERPPRSLIAQSLTAAEAKTVTQGDGVGIGWYGERPEPGVYREARPAWSDENLRSLCRHIRAGLFFAHVRAATGTDASRANCHPFAVGDRLFMHNGQVGGYGRIRRRLEAMIDDRLYDIRLGTSDSEALFLAALSHGLDADPARGFARVLEDVAREQRAAGRTSRASSGRRASARRCASRPATPTDARCTRSAGRPTTAARRCTCAGSTTRCWWSRSPTTTPATHGSRWRRTPRCGSTRT